jgi:hypothetical protein
MKNVLTIIILVIVSVLFVGCLDSELLWNSIYGYDSSSNNNDIVKDEFNISMDTKELKERGATKIKFELTNIETNEVITKTENIYEDSIMVSFNDILVGDYNIDIIVYNESNEVIGQGTGNVSITANNISDISININVNEEEEEQTGGVNITINITTNHNVSGKDGVYIGINYYDEQNNLSYADEDAIDYQIVFEEAGYMGETLIDVVYKNDILNVLNNVTKNTDKLFIFTFSGHGYYDSSTGDSNICMSDYYYGYDDEYISATELKNELDKLNRPVLVLIDACQSGEFVRNNNNEERKLFYNNFINVFEESNSRGGEYMVITSSDEIEYSTESGSIMNGTFSMVVTDGLGMPGMEYWNNFNGSYDADDNNDGIVTFGELANFCYNETLYHSEGGQTPQYTLSNLNFEIINY